MNKHSSVFLLLVRQKLKWALLCIAAIPVVSLSVYKLFFLNRGAETGSFQTGKEYLVFYITFAVASFGVAFACAGLLPGKSRRRYLLSRLQISERMVYFWDAVVCTLFFLLLWQTEVITLTAAGLMHDAARPDSTVPLDFVFAIYLRQFYHSVFPLSSPALLIRNVCYLLCTGAGCACISTYPGNSSSRGLGIVSLVVLAVFYTSGLTLEGIFFIALFTALAVVLTLRHLNNGKARDDNEAMDC